MQLVNLFDILTGVEMTETFNSVMHIHALQGVKILQLKIDF